MRRRDVLALPFARPPRPNIVCILVDDLRFDELACTGHPFIQSPHCDRLAREGAAFTNAFATTPLCSPSRASFLTGQYAHTHGVVDNVARDALSHRLVTWPRVLHDSGYATAFIGKWHMGNDESPRPGFDRWVSFRGQGQCVDPDLNIDGRVTKTSGYVTDLLTDHAVEFLERKQANPFCLYLSHKAVHPNIQQGNDGSVNPASANDAESFIPAPRHRELYAGARIPRRANYAKLPHGQPALERAVTNLDGITPDATILNRARMLKAVDDSLGRILTTLENSRQLDDTLVIFTSDHGYFYGEHGLGPERRLAYEEAIRIPMLVRYPKLFRPASRPAAFTLSVDLAATALLLAGVSAPHPMHGTPLHAPKRRDAVLVEYFSDTVFPNVRQMGYRAIRTDRWKYIRYEDQKGADEIYDLRNDPFEITNLIQDNRAPRAQLDRQLNRLLEQTGAPSPKS
ncbi:MAG: sulfatase-like hydrolase/transferase [Bryobacteraceae bacterium]